MPTVEEALVGEEGMTHPSAPGAMFLSGGTSGGSSSSDDPALEDSSSLSARQYVRGLHLCIHTSAHTHRSLSQCANHDISL